MISLSLNRTNTSAHIPLDQSKCMSMCCSFGIPLSGYFRAFTTNLTAYRILLSVTSPRATSSHYEHRNAPIFFVFHRICKTHLLRAPTEHPLSARGMTPWCTHAPAWLFVWFEMHNAAVAVVMTSSSDIFCGSATTSLRDFVDKEIPCFAQNFRVRVFFLHRVFVVYSPTESK